MGPASASGAPFSLCGLLLLLVPGQLRAEISVPETLDICIAGAIDQADLRAEIVDEGWIEIGDESAALFLQHERFMSLVPQYPEYIPLIDPIVTRSVARIWGNGTKSRVPPPDSDNPRLRHDGLDGTHRFYVSDESATFGLRTNLYPENATYRLECIISGPAEPDGFEAYFTSQHRNVHEATKYFARYRFINGGIEESRFEDHRKRSFRSYAVWDRDYLSDRAGQPVSTTFATWAQTKTQPMKTP